MDQICGVLPATLAQNRLHGPASIARERTYCDSIEVAPVLRGAAGGRSGRSELAMEREPDR
jgi:hypothetical protein